MENPSLNILLVEDHDLVRAGLGLIFEAVECVDKVWEASSGEECIALTREHSFDVVFMDIGLPGMDGLSAALRLLQIDEDMKIIVLTGLKQRPLSRVVLQAGIRGYMTKSSATSEVGLAIESVMRGGTYLSREIASQMAMESLNSGGKTNPLDNLSRRELQVALLLMNGHKPTEVGDMLFLSAKTVSTYKRRAYEKLHVNSLAELVEMGINSGFLGQTQ